MPESPPRRCPLCARLVKGRCPTCDGWARRTSSWPTSANDPRWRKVRARRLRIEPNCRTCGNPATQVDHLDGTDYQDDNPRHLASWLNLAMTRSLCGTC